MDWIKTSECLHFSRSNGKPRTRTKDPECIVIHYTASSLGSTMSWFMDPRSKVSAHLVISRVGTVYEVLGPEYIAWHAGTSSWRGRSGVNQFSYGIEMVASDSDGFTFTNAQYDSLRTVLWGGPVTVNGLKKDISGFANLWGLSNDPIGVADAQILGHEHVSPGRKSDPGPNFDWSRIATKKPLAVVPEKPQTITEQPPLSNTSWYTKLFKVITEVIQRLQRSKGTN